MTRLQDWIDNEGEIILREIGIREGQNILDFGCGKGIYTILASKIVASSGKIFALDSDEENLLSNLINKIKAEKIKNIEVIKTPGGIKIPLSDETMDVIMMYDILHLLDNNERMELFKEAYRVLKTRGIVSYHATHLGVTYNIALEEIHKKMKENGFHLDREFNRPLFHWAWIEDSKIINYLKG